MLSEFLSDVRTWAALVALGAIFLFTNKTSSSFPILNNYSNGGLEYRNKASDLIKQGLARYSGSPFALALPYGGTKVVLPSSMANWVKSNRSLCHQQLVKEDFFADTPGAEGLAMLHHPDELVRKIITTKLGQNDSILPAMNAGVVKGLKELWGGDLDKWKKVDWYSSTMGIIAHAAIPVFSGPELAGSEEWMALMQNYVMAYFTAVGDLHNWPTWMRGWVHWFLPSFKGARKHVQHAREIVAKVVEKRTREIEAAKRNGVKAPEYNDALAWSQTTIRDNKSDIDLADVQLCLSMAALFTTTELFRQALIEIAAHPDLAEPLRAEISEQIETHGLSINATNNMVLLDSVLKESQRRSAAIVVLERTALKDVTLPDGKVLAKGTQIMVDSTNLWDSNFYPNADAFDGHRFLNMRKEASSSNGALSANHQFVQSAPEFHVFGGGRHICPGRFFAGNELKLVLAHVLLNYDIRLGEGTSTNVIPNGVFAITNPMVEFEVRRRKSGDGLVAGLLR